MVVFSFVFCSVFEITESAYDGVPNELYCFIKASSVILSESSIMWRFCTSSSSFNFRIEAQCSTSSDSGITDTDCSDDCSPGVLKSARNTFIALRSSIEKMPYQSEDVALLLVQTLPSSRCGHRDRETERQRDRDRERDRERDTDTDTETKRQRKSETERYPTNIRHLTFL